MKVMNEVRKYVPYELQISGSCFSHMSLIRKLDTNGDISPYFDEKDVISALNDLGAGVTGGSTQYYSGPTTTKKGRLKNISFHYGQI